MTDKVFMVFNDNIDKLKQAYWFVNMFIKEEYRDLSHLFEVGAEVAKEMYGISCHRYDDGWVWVDKNYIRSYTSGMTQVYYRQKDLGEL